MGDKYQEKRRGPVVEARNERPSREPERKVCGLRACEALAKHNREQIRKIYLAKPRLDDFGDLLSWCAKNKIGYKIAEAPELKKISGSEHHEGVVMLAKISPAPTLINLINAELKKPKSTIVWLDNIGNPHNFGAIARSAGYFGFSAVILSGPCPWRLSPSAHRIAEGALEICQTIEVADPSAALKLFRDKGFSVISSSPHAKNSLFEAEFPSHCVMVFGAEGQGLSPEIIKASDLTISIVGAGEVESLNVSASAAVIMAERFRQACQA